MTIMTLGQHMVYAPVPEMGVTEQLRRVFPFYLLPILREVILFSFLSVSV